MRPPRAVLGLAGKGVPRQSKMAGGRDGVESRSQSVESTVDWARASQARQKAKADTEASN